MGYSLLTTVAFICICLLLLRCSFVFGYLVGGLGLLLLSEWLCCWGLLVGSLAGLGVKNWGPKTVKNGPRVWAFCKIEFPGIQKPVQFLAKNRVFSKSAEIEGLV